MKKQIAQVSLVASLVLAGISAAHAGTPAKVTVTGSVDSTSCSLDVGGTATKSLELGGWVDSDFKNGAAPMTGMHVVTASKQPIALKLSKCAGKGDGDSLFVEVTGQTLSAHDNIFNQNPEATAGVALTVTPNNGTETLVQTDNSYAAFTYDAGAAANAADGQVMTFNAYMVSTAAAPTVQTVTAPINFNVVNS
ncbi:fimbrial protein [Enterobacter asburiae]|uniref:fimbrial protein n=1 Tax=Enterobacter asburiae TaxID=61645 RepID=UPI0021CFE4F6|nr:hypothetical protein [Enterobacter asburiae]MCU6244081.1 hypothetical protein [Enterobacter asburiae]